MRKSILEESYFWKSLDAHSYTDRERNYSQNPKSQSNTKIKSHTQDKLHKGRKKATFRDLRVAYMSTRICSLTPSISSIVIGNLSSTLVEPSPSNTTLLVVTLLKGQKHEEREERREKEEDELASRVWDEQEGKGKLKLGKHTEESTHPTRSN